MNVLLLDRDGTVIRDPKDERVDSEDEIELFPDTIEALRYLAQHDFSVIFISNQAAIAEGRLRLEDVERIQRRAIEMLAQSGIQVLKTYICPHFPEDKCECRKPKPAMLLRAIEEFNLDPKNIYMVGDRESDIMAGVNAGTKTILVQTGNTPVTVAQATYTAKNLLDAVTYAVEH